MSQLRISELTIKAKMSRGEKLITESISFNAESCELLGIVGESGCGKTMTALSIFGLLPENCSASGRIQVGNTDITAIPNRELAAMRGRELIYIPQSGSDFLNPSLKVKTHLMETLKRLGVPRTRYAAKSAELLRTAGFTDPEAVLGKYPFQLSGGMAQRVVLAIALAATPKLVVADEPTRGIDRETALAFISLLRESFKSAAVLVITHDISIARLCDRLLVMNAGTIVENGNAEQVLSAPVSKFTQKLIEALPERWYRTQGAVADA